METSVDTLVYQLEDDDTNVRWNSLQKLRRIAAVETSHFPVRNTRRFLQCVRRRIVNEADPCVAIEALRLLGDVMVSLGDDVDQILSSILPHLISILPRTRKDQEDSEEDSDILQEEMLQVFRKYTNVTNDLQAVADLLVNIGLGSGQGAVRETSLVVLMRLLDERFLKHSKTNRDATRSAIGRGDKALIVALVQAIIPAMEDTNENVVVVAEEAIAKLESYWGSRFSSDMMKFLSTEDKRTLQEHQEPIADFLQVCTTSTSPPASPPQSLRPTSTASFSDACPSKAHPLTLTEELYFGFLKADIVAILTTYMSNSNADWKKRATAVEKLYAACKEVDAGTLRGFTVEERAKRMDELEKLFDVLVHLTQDVDVHLVKRALQIAQILFRKLSPPRYKEDDVQPNQNDENAEVKDAAFYMKKMLSPTIETAANFVGDDDEMESFVYTLLGQVFASGCVSVTSIEQVLASTSLRHRRSQIREEAVKVWIVLLLITDRESLLSDSYAPNEYVVQTLGRLLGDTNARVRDLAFEVAAVLAMVCCCNIYALLETLVEDEYVAERVDWAALRARLRRKNVPELRSNCTLRIKSTAVATGVCRSRTNRLASSVEQSLDSISEMRVLVRNGLKSHEHQSESSVARSEGVSTTVDINEKLSALRKKMDQPRSKRTQRPQSEKAMTTSKLERVNDNKIELAMQVLPRSKSSPEQSANNLTDFDESPRTMIYQSPKSKRVYSNKIAVTLLTAEEFTTAPRQLSPQQLQSLQSDSHNYEDRSKFTDRARVTKAESPSHSSYDERPICPLASSGESDQIYLSAVRQDELDNNEVRPTRKSNGERVVSLATRKRLEAKTKQDGERNSNNPPRLSPEKRVSENEPSNSKDFGEAPRSGKQEPRYLEPHEITPLMNPKHELNRVLSQLQSDDWEANFEALSTVRRLALHHASVIDAVKVHTIISGIMKQVSNLRSSVSKNALMALESMCAAFSRAMDSEVESIVPVLLKRCADSNAFVCESAAASLRAVVLKCTTSRVVSALTSRASSKAAPIRREVARGIYALILGQADIQTSKDLPPVLQLVGRCLEDSNNEVRDIAKQAILHLHHIQRLPSERIKRFLSASAQSKVNSALSGKVAYVPQLLPKSSSLMEIASELPSSATKKRETTSAPKAKKTAKLSSRASPPASSNGTRLKMNSDELHRLEAKLDSNNWKDRFDALNETTNFICGCASALVESGQMLNLFDQLIKRLDDGNAKVNVLALECMERIVPAVGSGMEQILPNFVPAIAKNLANARTSSLALSVVRQLCAHADNRSLCQQFAIQARSANSRVIPALLDTLTQLTAHSLDDKNNYVLTRHVLPLAVDLLKEAKSGVKEANSRLLRQLRRTLGPTAISNAASKLSSTQQDKLAAVLR
ncbi:CLASP N terminal [Phytophthora infestans]|uniref:CLASP N terminal n=1 Tax=Phytophthora infestans TaxID=4787 RepID=A0A8S9UNF3_PHYIN|nr:CLASP N terminal [Phytophthora infestans]